MSRRERVQGIKERGKEMAVRGIKMCQVWTLMTPLSASQASMWAKAHSINRWGKLMNWRRGRKEGERRKGFKK